MSNLSEPIAVETMGVFNNLVEGDWLEDFC